MRTAWGLLASALLAIACSDASTRAPQVAPQPPYVARDPGVWNDVARPACIGSDLDLDALLDSGRCPGGLRPSAGEDELGIQLWPSWIALEPGEEATAKLVLVNRTARILVVEMMVGCDSAPEVSVAAVDGDGTVEDSGCKGVRLTGCTYRGVRVGIAAHGRATKRVTVIAAAHQRSPACDVVAETPLPPGAYQLRAWSGVFARDPTTNARGSMRIVTGSLTVAAPP